MDLLARDGRAVLIGHNGLGKHEADPYALSFNPGLAEALHEWAKAAEATLHTASADEQKISLVVARGQELAAQVALNMGVDISYINPFTEESTVVAVPQHPQPPVQQSPQRDDQTPWATGLTVSGVTGAMIVVTIVALSLGLSQTSGWLVLLANLLIAGGIAPSLWLSRTKPVWRWVAYGVVAGFIAAWCGLLFTLL
jgi:hypothetical protein